MPKLDLQLMDEWDIYCPLGDILSKNLPYEDIHNIKLVNFEYEENFASTDIVDSDPDSEADLYDAEFMVSFDNVWCEFYLQYTDSCQ